MSSLQDNLELLLHFNKDASDASGNGNDGALGGGASIDNSNQKLGEGCAYFDNVDGRIGLSYLNFDEISVSFHFKRSSLDAVNADTVFGAWYWAADTQLREGFDIGRFAPGSNTTLEFVLETKTSGGVVTEGKITYDIGDTTGTYVKCTGTYNKTAGVQKLFIDGVLRGTFSHTAGNTIVPLSSYPNMWAGSSRVNSGWFHGYIDEFALWSRPLSDGGVSVGETAGGEIAQLYNFDKGLVIDSVGNYTSLFRRRRR